MIAVEVTRHLPVERSAAPVLMGLAPIGVGTRMVESLSGYVRRLASLHRVLPTQIQRLVNESGDPIVNDMPLQPLWLDLPTATAYQFACRLADMVRSSSVRRLGASWHQHWAPAQSFKLAASWCPDCLSEMETQYTPLLWSLKAFTVCPQHQISLVESCPHCRETQSVQRMSSAKIWMCCHCGKSLKCEPMVVPQPRTCPPVRCDQSTLASELIGDLQAHGDRVCAPPDFKRMVQMAIDFKHVSSASELASLAKISKGTLHRHCTSASNPTVDVLLRICVAARIAPGSLFGFRTADDPSSLARSTSAYYLPDSRVRLARDWEAIRRALYAAMHEENIPSISEFAARHGVGPREVKAAWGPMTRSLTLLRQRQIQERRQAAVASLTERIADSARALQAEGVRASGRRIAITVAARRGSQLFAAAMGQLRVTSDLSDHANEA
jgi:transcriptional regulator with XRE-family HTH domain